MMKKLNDFPSRTEKVVINQLGVDETYQRPVSKAKVNKIVKNFNPIGMGPTPSIRKRRWKSLDI